MPDAQLEGILNRRLCLSEGEESAHCFIRSPPRSPELKPEEASTCVSRKEAYGCDWYDDEECMDRMEHRMPASPDVGVTPSKDRSTELSTAAADIAAGSPHFSLETPPSSPREQKANESSEEALDNEKTDEVAEDDVQYEWQFDIMNSLPSDKAVKLVNFLKKSERERAQATATADQLQKEVRRLSSTEDFAVSSSETTAQKEEETIVAAPFTKKGRNHFWHWIVVGPLLMAVAAGCAIRFFPDAFSAYTEMLQTVTPSTGMLSTERHSTQYAQVPSVAESKTESIEAQVTTITSTTTSSSVSQTPAAPIPPPQKIMSASLYGHPTLQPHHPAIAQDVAAAVDATAELGGALAFFPLIKSAYRLGRVVLKSDALKNARAILSCTITLVNDGTVAWPAETMLRLVMGPDIGLAILTLGQAMHSGAPVELNMQFELPVAHRGKGMLRSGWILESRGEPFGPLLLLESQVV